MFLSTSPIKWIWFRPLKSNFKFWWSSKLIMVFLIITVLSLFYWCKMSMSPVLKIVLSVRVTTSVFPVEINWNTKYDHAVSFCISFDLSFMGVGLVNRAWFCVSHHSISTRQITDSKTCPENQRLPPPSLFFSDLLVDFNFAVHISSCVLVICVVDSAVRK